MARHGILLLSFGFILLAFKQVSTTPIVIMNSVPPPPDFLCPAARIILILALMVAAVCIRKRTAAIKLKSWAKILLFFLIVVLSFVVVWLIPPIPVLPQWCFTVIGAIVVVASLVFIPAIFCKCWADKLKDFTEDHKQTYWMIVWSVYIIGWLKAMLSIPAEEPAFHIVFWFGFAWFCLITFVFIKAAWQTEQIQ